MTWSNTSTTMSSSESSSATQLPTLRKFRNGGGSLSTISRRGSSVSQKRLPSGSPRHSTGPDSAQSDRALLQMKVLQALHLLDECPRQRSTTCRRGALCCDTGNTPTESARVPGRMLHRRLIAARLRSCAASKRNDQLFLLQLKAVISPRDWQVFSRSTPR